MTPDDLRKIAEAATPGEWVRDGISVLGAREEHDLNTGLARLATMMMPWERERMEANAEFIATFNPARVLEMLDTLRRAEIRLGYAKTVIDRLEARLAAVEKLHSPVEAKAANGDTIMVCDHCVGDLAYVFDEQLNWPCYTIKAARGE